MVNCKVKMTELKNVPIQDLTAFYATFKDSLDNEYWMEFDYSRSQSDKLSENPAYNSLSKDIPQNTDIVLSFFYMGKTEWKYDDEYLNDLKIQVVPIS